MSHQVHEMSQSSVFLPYNERPPCSVYFFFPSVQILSRGNPFSTLFQTSNRSLAVYYSPRVS